MAYIVIVTRFAYFANNFCYRRLHRGPDLLFISFVLTVWPGFGELMICNVYLSTVRLLGLPWYEFNIVIQLIMMLLYVFRIRTS